MINSSWGHQNRRIIFQKNLIRSLRRWKALKILLLNYNKLHWTELRKPYQEKYTIQMNNRTIKALRRNRSDFISMYTVETTLRQWLKLYLAEAIGISILKSQIVSKNVTSCGSLLTTMQMVIKRQTKESHKRAALLSTITLRYLRAW